MDKNEYKKPYGIWEVTTEGDCEGRSTRRLGVFEGYLDDIALALADKTYYSLHFTKIDIHTLDHVPPKKNSVEVTLNIESGTWDMTKGARAAYAEQMLKDRDVRVEMGENYASFKIVSGRKTQAELRQEILAKLTPKERAILGV